MCSICDGRVDIEQAEEINRFFAFLESSPGKVFSWLIERETSVQAPRPRPPKLIS